MKKKKGDKIMNKKFGFTLAEVLITLGIIGVVAAMTIPTLIANTNSAKFRSQYKKTISTLNQAALMATAQYDVDYGDATALTSDTGINSLTAEDNSGTTSLAAIFKSTLTSTEITTTVPTGYAPVGAKAGDNNTTTVNGAPTNAAYLTMADGSMLVFDYKATTCTKPISTSITTWSTDDTSSCDEIDDADEKAACIAAIGKGRTNKCLGYIDVNGKSLPNKEVNCGGETATAVKDGTCEVPKDSAHMTDIYPVAFHDATVEPITNAARYVLTTAK